MEPHVGDDEPSTGPEEAAEVRTSIRAVVETGHDMCPDAAHMRDDFTQLIRNECLVAHIQGTPLSDEAARLIASVFACSLPDGSALHRFGSAESVEPDRLKAEMAKLRNGSRLNADGREFLNWIAGYFLAATAPELIPDATNASPRHGLHAIEHHPDLDLVVALHSHSTSPRADPAPLYETITPLILEGGLPMLAYLRLPAVDAALPDVDLRFRMAYSGSWPGVDELLDEYLQTLQRATPAHGLPHDVRYRELTPDDQTLLRLQLGAKHQLVHVNGQVHLFRRAV